MFLKFLVIGTQFLYQVLIAEESIFRETIRTLICPNDTFSIVGLEKHYNFSKSWVLRDSSSKKTDFQSLDIYNVTRDKLILEDTVYADFSNAFERNSLINLSYGDYCRPKHSSFVGIRS